MAAELMVKTFVITAAVVVALVLLWAWRAGVL